MKKAVSYQRVSGENQVGNYSIPTQREAIHKYAVEHDMEIIREFIEPGVSGNTLDRPALTELREFVKSGHIEVVIIYDQDRLSREFINLMLLVNEFEQAGIELAFVLHQSVGKTAEDKMLFGMRGLFAEYERAKTMERTKRGRLARAKAGKLVSGKGTKLYGYNYMPGKGKDEGIRLINDQEASIVRDIFQWYVEEHLTIHGIAYRLMSLGIPSPAGNRHWCSGTLHKILHNTSYIGKTYAFTQTYVEAEKHSKMTRKHKSTHRVFKPASEWVEIYNATPSIISDDLFNKAQAQLQRNRELASRNTKREYLLRGYAFCEHCGRRYQGAVKSYQTKQGVREYLYYRCSNNFKINCKRCSNSSWKAEDLEAMVWREVESVLSNPDVVLAGLKALQGERDNTLEQELRQTDSRLKALDKDQDQLLQWALKGFPEKTVIRENERINASRIELKQRKAGLERRIETARQVQVDIQGIEQACQLIGDNLAELSFENRRLALEALNIRVWLDEDRISIEGAIPTTRGAVVSTPSNRNGERMPSISACQPTQLGQSIPLG